MIFRGSFDGGLIDQNFTRFLILALIAISLSVTNKGSQTLTHSLATLLESSSWCGKQYSEPDQAPSGCA
ncbi:MAG: hypothetical protein ACJA0N_002440 [Pseudohongiellaceae bacterium]|jgi:hypothetical protein